MSQAQRDLSRAWAEADVAHVLRVLRRAPRPMSELLEDEDLAGWSSRRLEEAVVSAWSRNLISINPSDHLVAL